MKSGLDQWSHFRLIRRHARWSKRCTCLLSRPSIPCSLTLASGDSSAARREDRATSANREETWREREDRSVVRRVKWAKEEEEEGREIIITAAAAASVAMSQSRDWIKGRKEREAVSRRTEGRRRLVRPQAWKRGRAMRVEWAWSREDADVIERRRLLRIPCLVTCVSLRASHAVSLVRRSPEIAGRESRSKIVLL